MHLKVGENMITLNGNFTEEQCLQIYYGVDDGLSDTEVSTYAKSEFSPELMQLAREAFADGLNTSQVEAMIATHMR